MLLLFYLSAIEITFSIKSICMAKKDYQEFKLKINMKTILLYEEMSGKSFYEIGGDDILLLIYCSLVVNNDLTLTFPRFEIIMQNEKILRDLMAKCQSELDFIQQFIKQSNSDVENINTDEVRDNKISPVIHAMLLQNNLDINYVMYEMRLWEVAPLIKSIEEKTKSDMVEKRFWAYLNICPHIDSKKIKGPEDVIPFPWEKENKKKEAVEFMDKNKDAIMAFFNKNKKTEGEDGTR